LPQDFPSPSEDMPFIELQSVDSTNNYARQQIKTADLPELPDGQHPPQHGTAYFAHEQVAGKGQRGKNWASQKGANIALSILVKPSNLPLEMQFQLSACAAVSVQELLAKYAGEETKIKWPNDLYWQDRKAGGILIESVIRGKEGPANWQWAIVGIGINVNQTSFPEDLPNPVSLKQITGKNFEPVLLATALHKIFLSNYDILITQGFDTIYDAYHTALYKKGQTVRFKKGNRNFEGLVKQVTRQGKLVLQHAFEEEFDFGEIEWVI
jgi:BirA family transcriptional regulator, biotin operon repressor / biotin---[acetyl-CoA-carboxylase] ligase